MQVFDYLLLRLKIVQLLQRHQKISIEASTADYVIIAYLHRVLGLPLVPPWNERAMNVGGRYEFFRNALTAITCKHGLELAGRADSDVVSAFVYLLTPAVDSDTIPKERRLASQPNADRLIISFDPTELLNTVDQLSYFRSREDKPDLIGWRDTVDTEWVHDQADLTHALFMDVWHILDEMVPQPEKGVYAIGLPHRGAIDYGHYVMTVAHHLEQILGITHFLVTSKAVASTSTELHRAHKLVRSSLTSSWIEAIWYTDSGPRRIAG
jgi:hypothetical protein